MVQRDFFDPAGIMDLGQLSGASGAHALQIYGDRIYAAKCFLANRPYTLLNEHVAAGLAQALNLPIPIIKHIRFQDKLWFGVEWEPAGGHLLTEEKIPLLLNAQDIPRILAFDVLICNHDRHQGNIVIQQIYPSPERYRLWIIDHSHCLAADQLSKDVLIGKNDGPDGKLYISRLPIFINAVKDINDFDGILRDIEAIDGIEISKILQTTPKEWVTHIDDLTFLETFLSERKRKVRSLIAASVDIFPNIQGR
jgi:hypothetical protein